MLVNGVLYQDETHYSFTMEKLRQLQEAGCKPDVYAQSLFYTLGVCAETRAHFGDLFDMTEHGIKLGGLGHGWQTGTSRKVTRLAFNLWNGCTYDSEEDAEADRQSPCYAVDEIFCCGYQPYFMQAVRLRFPEYQD